MNTWKDKIEGKLDYVTTMVRRCLVETQPPEPTSSNITNNVISR